MGGVYQGLGAGLSLPHEPIDMQVIKVSNKVTTVKELNFTPGL